MLGRMGALFSRMGLATEKTGNATGGASTAGQPIGLLLVLTKAS